MSEIIFRALFAGIKNPPDKNVRWVKKVVFLRELQLAL